MFVWTLLYGSVMIVIFYVLVKAIGIIWSSAYCGASRACPLCLRVMGDGPLEHCSHAPTLWETNTILLPETNLAWGIQTL